MTARLATLKFRMPKDSALRKPTPIWLGRTFWSSGNKRYWNGFYVRLGTRCFGLLIDCR